MAWTVAVRNIVDSPVRVVAHCVGVTDGASEETDGIKINVSDLNNVANNQACTRVKIMKIWYTTIGMTSVILEWDATTDVVAWVLPGAQEGYMDFSKFGGITNNAGSGITGDLLLTTVGGADANDRYSIVIEAEKS